jgi:hypothetical protein
MQDTAAASAAKSAHACSAFIAAIAAAAGHSRQVRAAAAAAVVVAAACRVAHHSLGACPGQGVVQAVDLHILQAAHQTKGSQMLSAHYQHAEDPYRRWHTFNAVLTDAHTRENRVQTTNHRMRHTAALSKRASIRATPQTTLSP